MFIKHTWAGWNIKNWRGLESSTKLVEYSGKPNIEGKDLNKHNAILSEPSNILAIEYAGTEVFSNSNKKAVNNACTDYLFIFRL